MYNQKIPYQVAWVWAFEEQLRLVPEEGAWAAGALGNLCLRLAAEELTGQSEIYTAIVESLHSIL